MRYNHTAILTTSTGGVVVTHGLTGRILGALVFLLGIAILVITAREAWSLMNRPIPSPGQDLGRLGVIALDVVKRTVLLLVVALIGAFAASRGAAMYGVSLGVPWRGRRTPAGGAE